VKSRTPSTDVDDELAAMRGTLDADSVTYLDRKEIHGVCDVEEEPRTDSRRKEVSADVSSSSVSRDPSPTKSVHLRKTQSVKLASDKGTVFGISFCLSVSFLGINY